MVVIEEYGYLARMLSVVSMTTESHTTTSHRVPIRHVAQHICHGLDHHLASTIAFD